MEEAGDRVQAGEMQCEDGGLYPSNPQSKGSSRSWGDKEIDCSLALVKGEDLLAPWFSSSGFQNGKRVILKAPSL
jgi:hypothetical protein